jgi:hypothetical protein
VLQFFFPALHETSSPGSFVHEAVRLIVKPQFSRISEPMDAGSGKIFPDSFELGVLSEDSYYRALESN